MEEKHSVEPTPPLDHTGICTNPAKQRVDVFPRQFHSPSSNCATMAGLTRLCTWFFLALLGFSLSSGASTQEETTQWPLHNDGLNKVVQWDHYSFQVNDQRIFIFSGEFHYWRIPVPGLWRDILEKIKAAGFTAFAFYANWAYHAPNNHTLDFSTGAHDIRPLFELAKEIGLYIIVRPGPYINAEVTAGGFPLWLTTGDYGSLRNNDTRYTKAWTPYFSEMSQVTSKYQVTDGENALCYQIENEYGDQWVGNPSERDPNETAISYMELLEANARKNGITVPLTSNDPNMNTHSWGSDWSNDGGNVDVSGVDSYPSCWTCDLSQCTSTNGVYVPFQVVEYYEYFQENQPTMPEFMPEFQGGSYNPWGGPEGGCAENSDAEFANLFYRWNIGQRVTAMSLYMLFGGTNWGAIAAPVTASSYDYSSPISEDRSIGSKYYETKLLALFTRAAKDLTMTELKDNGTQYTTNSAVRAYELRNPETNAGFYPTFHVNTSLSTNEAFRLHVDTSAGALTVPRHGGTIRLNGHQSKIIVTDFTFGSNKLLYSTAEVLTYAVFDKTPTLVLWVPTGESGEFAVKGAKKGSIKKCQGCSHVEFYHEDNGLTITFTQSYGMSVVELDNDVRVVLLDRTHAYRFWAPALTNDPLVPETESVLIQGPYLVRGAKLSGSTLAVTGDAINTTALEVFAPRHVKTITWNGKMLHTQRTEYGSLKGLPAAPASVKLPSFGTWKTKDSLPERFADYDDSGPAWVAWLNGQLIGSYFGSAAAEQANLTLSFANATLHHKEPNVLLVVHDDTGHDETSGALNPRGILGAKLLGSSDPTFTHWKIAGTAGGESNIDPVRGVYNEDGLHGERVGWHLPGFDDSKWPSSSTSAERKSEPSALLSFKGATVQFFRTTIPLNLPPGHDISISFVLSTPTGSTKAYRAQLFVNGYQYGRYNPYIGNQVVYPVPAGILNYSGENTVAVAVWAQTVEGASIGVDWRVNYIADSSLDVVQLAREEEALRPVWTKEREVYA
ncbi:beta-galactosidase B [Penicillium riverlandense]|uniref:beta-galactosidase B n=1 Tax=Penicillium riverlandense TaxID=1903569 RepID=UPI002549888B|nr:beta-galactosidase B [Penicillium riverlandense]KAJ5819060.1 beta-galactosidase B [Penicillium riverlandense]